MLYGHLKLIVLKILSKKPMTGYTLMQEIQKTIGGCKPSCGSIYPLLEELSTDKLVVLNKDGRKKIYTLSDKGKAELQKFKVEKGKLINSIIELWNVFDSLSDKDPTAKMYSHYVVDMLDSVKKDGLPFKEIFPDVMEAYINLLRLYHDGKIAVHKKELTTLLRNLNKKMVKLT
jgi:DNA-binding PadR family transcriptional regulator